MENHTTVIFLLLQELLSAMVTQKLHAILVRLESELVREELDVDVGLVPASTMSIIPSSKRVRTYALQMLAKAASRSRTMNMSIKYAPMFGVSRYNLKNLW